MSEVQVQAHVQALRVHATQDADAGAPGRRAYEGAGRVHALHGDKLLNRGVDALVQPEVIGAKADDHAMGRGEWR